MEKIEVRLNEDYLEKKDEYDTMAKKVIYTGTINACLDYSLGSLEYRTVRFENEILDIPNFRGNAVIAFALESCERELKRTSALAVMPEPCFCGKVYGCG